MKRNSVAWAALVLSAAALISSRGMTRVVPAAQEIPAEGQKTAQSLSEAFEAVAEFVQPSVVQISVEKKSPVGNIIRRVPKPGDPQSPQDELTPKDFEEMLKRFFPDSRRENQQFGGGPAAGTGSGFVYDDKGHILTNNHVVADAKKIVVTFADGEKANATVVGTDPGADVAVIKVETTSYRPVLKGKSSKLRTGQWVLALGSPFGLSHTVTAGIVSATERNSVNINEYESFIQTDAAINPGNSGGPLVDMFGRVVGINSAIVTGSRSNSGVGFAIPMDMAANLADRLIKDGKISRARMGALLQPLSPALAKQLGMSPKTKGVLINQVIEGSPAAKAGLKSGDVVTHFNGAAVFSVPTLRNMVSTSDIGHAFEVKYLREGEEKTASVVLGAAEQVDGSLLSTKERSTPRSRPEPAGVEVKDFGLTVQPITPELSEKFGHGKNQEGLVVTAVKEDSPAAEAGLTAGDLITKVIANKKVQTVKDVKQLQDASTKGNEIALYVEKTEGPGRYVTLLKPTSK